METSDPPRHPTRRPRASATVAYTTGIVAAVVVGVGSFAAVHAAGPEEYVAQTEVLRTVERTDGGQTAWVRWRSPEGAPHTRNVDVPDDLRGKRRLVLVVEERAEAAPRVSVVSHRPDRRDDLFTGLAVAVVSAAFGALVIASLRGFGLLPDLSRPGSRRPVSESRGFYWRS